MVISSYESQMAPAAALPESTAMSVMPITPVRASTEPSTPAVDGTTVEGSGTRRNAQHQPTNSAEVAALRVVSHADLLPCRKQRRKHAPSAV